jgi:beta-glucosidase
LSYTSFAYSNLVLENTYKAGDTVKLSVTVQNIGPLRGDEVVQVYASHLNANIKVPVRSLVEFQRVSLEPGESKQIDFEIAPTAFSVFNEKGERTIVPGQFEIAVGGGQPGIKVGKTETPGMKTKISLQ